MLGSGSRIGSYELLSPLRAGGMGEVYRAKDLKRGTTAMAMVQAHLTVIRG